MTPLLKERFSGVGMWGCRRGVCVRLARRVRHHVDALTHVLEATWVVERATDATEKVAATGHRADRADALDGRPTHLRLAYTVTPSGGDPTECEYWLPLEYTPCNFGGVRPWFRCPADGCGERVGTLHRPPGRNLFACRECYDIGYLTSRRSGDALKKTELRYQRAFRKVDAKDRRPHPNNAPHWSTKPKDA
jgi:hypothetical protein